MKRSNIKWAVLAAGLMFTANSNAWWGNNWGGWNSWPVWTPMYWMEEMSDVWDDDYYGAGPYGYSPYGYGAPYSYGYGGPYGYGPQYGYGNYGPWGGYTAAPMTQPQAAVQQD